MLTKMSLAIMTALALPLLYLSGEKWVSDTNDLNPSGTGTKVEIQSDQALGDIDGDGKPFSKIKVDGQEIDLDDVEWHYNADTKKLTISGLSIPTDKVVEVKCEYPGNDIPSLTAEIKP